MNKLVFAAVLALGAAAISSAAEQPKKSEKSRQELIELHQKMADQHMKMVDCLKTDKTVDACRQEAMKDCPMAKSGKCPFMGEGCAECGMQGPRRHHGKGAMKGSSDEAGEKD